MALRIETFDNVRGGNVLYKALSHPHVAEAGRELVAKLARRTPAAIVDSQGAAAGFAEIFGLRPGDVAEVYVQDIARIGSQVLGCAASPVTDLKASRAKTVLIAAFDAERLIAQLDQYLPKGAQVLSLDGLRLPELRLTNPRNYLDPLNFATNFALFRDGPDLHTRLVTANYWKGYGAGNVTCWLTLFDEAGKIIAEWTEPVGSGGHIVSIDSREVRRRFGLGDFTGQLFIHAIGAAGHDVVKYALDTFGDKHGTQDGALSCTHDANAWPADRYAGLPAPADGERVILWVQNSHPTPIPRGAIALAPMGENTLVPLDEPIGAFASRAIDVATLLPDLAWPRQIEVHAGKHAVRPRYEVVTAKRRRIAHVNVERDDLRPNPELPGLADTLGKGYLLPAPILPRAEWESLLLPTPMAVSQAELPIDALVYAPDGTELGRYPLGRLPRSHAAALTLHDLVEPCHGIAAGDYGHVELVYDFSEGGQGDGWLHALFRYRHRASNHVAETSFGAHVFNTILTYRDEPQSYVGRPPGLSTRLFLRLGEGAYDTLCHLIYPASQPWRSVSATDIVLYDSSGAEIARESLAIPCSGSRLWRYHAMFDAPTRARAGDGAYAIIRDSTCRLFGYHGLVGHNGAFSLDHMFGF